MKTKKNEDIQPVKKMEKIYEQWIGGKCKGNVISVLIREIQNNNIEIPPFTY